MPATLEDKFANVLTALEKMVKNNSKIPFNIRNWDSADCAEFLCKTPKYFTSHIACKPDFPEPIKIGGGHPIWNANDVVKWLKMQKQKR